MAGTYVRYPSNSSGVTSLNTLTGDVTLAAGANITLTPSGNTITIASSAGSSLAIGAAVSGSTANAVLYVDGSNNLGNSSAMLFDPVANQLTLIGGTGDSSLSSSIAVTNPTIDVASIKGLIDATPTSTNTHTFTGISGDAEAHGNSTMSGAISGGIFTVGSNGSGSRARLRGALATAVPAGSSNITNASGLEVLVANGTSGTLTNGYGLRVLAPTNGAGTFTNSYGLYIEDPAGVGSTLSRAIHVVAGTSFFGGSILANTLTASMAVVTDSSKNLASSVTTLAELAFVSGVTSAIQTQLNAKGVGSVTSVGISVPGSSIFGTSGTPVTSSGTLGITTTGTSGGIPYFSSTSALSTSALLTANAIVLGGGAATAPVVLGSLGTTSTVLHGNASGAPTFGAVALATDVSGSLPASNLVGTDIATVGTVTAGTWSATTIALNKGGTGQTTKAAAFDALQPMTTGGDLIYGGASGTGTRLANGSAGQYLKSAGSTSAPAWQSFTAPTVQKFTSSSGTYTTAANVLYIRVQMVGAGGGGGGSANAVADAGAGGTGGTSTFGTTLLSTVGGTGGGANTNLGGAGGTASLGTGPVGTVLSGGSGNETGNNQATAGNRPGGSGGNSAFGGGGGGAKPGATNTGGGGGGAEGPATGNAGSGGGAGGYVDAIITSPSATYSYAIGAAGAAGTAGTGGSAGQLGGSGYIIVWEYYQ